jgi:hypothetical protein
VKLPPLDKQALHLKHHTAHHRRIFGKSAHSLVII